jgi:lipoprotein-anchoring transpeptidase ErfK/SrfK
VEQALTVYTPTPIEGAWSWSSPSQVQFRPKDYWPANIDVTVDLDLKGVEAAKRVYGARNTSTTFTIGPRMITQIDAQSYTAKVFRDGERVRVMPITTGKAGFETRSGVKVVVSKERTRIMDAATGGTEESDPEYYRLEVEYAMRVTYSGEFLHAAPWSVGSQGYANVSHGCVGMSTANAQWLYDMTNVGDVVEVSGTSNPQNLGNGITVWNEGWKEWLADSTTGPVMTVAAPTTAQDDATTSPDGPQDDAAGPVDGTAVQEDPLVAEASYGR